MFQFNKCPISFMAIFLCISRQGSACRCRETSVYDSFQEASSVFIGTLQEFDLDSKFATFHVDKLAKGALDDERNEKKRVYTESNSCGITEWFKDDAAGQKYLVYSFDSAGRESTNLCTRTKPFSNAEWDEYQEILNLKHASLVKQVNENQSGRNAITVKISQSAIGQCGKGLFKRRRKTNKEKAMVFMAVWLDPDTNEPTCGFRQRNVGPCFEHTFEIGCDPSTKQAPIDIYIKDENFRPVSLYRVRNPKVGRCRLGRKRMSKSTIRYTKTFECASEKNAPANARTGSCGATFNNCLEGAFCRNTSVGYKCQKFEDIGRPCEGYQFDENGDYWDGRCDPEKAYCKFPSRICMIPDSSGICTRFGLSCATDEDCATDGEYCDRKVGKCKERLPVGYCCNPQEGHCVAGTSCRTNKNSDEYTDHFNLCRPKVITP